MKVLDLFSGIGGFSLGLERAGFETVAFCEVDKKCHQVLKKHWPNVPIFDDVQTLNGDDIGQSVDVICGGFPCQDISLAGKGAGLEGKRSGLWWEFHRLIKEIKPKWAIIENVSALRGRGLDQVLRSLAEIGYDAEWHCIPASAVGAPHRRDRIWIVAYANSDDGRTWSGSKSLDGQAWMELGSGSQGFFERETLQAVANADNKRSQGRLYWWANQKRESELGYLGRCSTVHGQSIKDQWSTEPDVGRVANGIPNRVDRLKQLGNAVVPQIPELIGRAIIEFENAS
jgi:DNA (cytosine-5)-methyltransferase 1